jgi:hypothetical protein
MEGLNQTLNDTTWRKRDGQVGKRGFRNLLPNANANATILRTSHMSSEQFPFRVDGVCFRYLISSSCHDVTLVSHP